mmetsp:Transcript_53925/g.148707  ORF Transcript_53925/g.148707 Transcript_53925/m.148707 type:complete len:93 (-) Transcript_53925:246-524(-)
MASGYGTHTPIGRCFPLWTEFSDCVGASADRNDCKDFLEDYMECLHHKKETARINTLAAVRDAKLKAGEDLPETVTEQVTKGTIKLPFTNVK